jgi:RHS repeat-associated protein
VVYGHFGRVVAQHRANAGTVPAAVPSRCPFGFSSKYLDAGSGLLYFDRRYYSADLGRWLCRDPLGEKGGANLYATCQNDPVNAVDPLGLLTPQRFFDKWDETKQKEWLRSRLHSWAPAIWNAAEKHGVPARLLSITILNEMIDYGTWGDYRVGGGYNFLERTVEVLTGLEGASGLLR